MSDTTSLSERVSKLETELKMHVARLNNDIAEIRHMLGQTATKADINALGAKIDSAVSGLLRDALNAVPARQALVFTSIMLTSVITIGVLVILLQQWVW